MRASEFINEIKFSNSISDSAHIFAALDPVSDQIVGTVDHHAVHIKDGGNCIVFYISDKHDVLGYIIVEKHPINGYYPFRQAEKRSSKSGIMMSLIQFLVSENIKLIIKDDEPMTRYGLTWIANIINNPRGLNIHDGHGNKIDIEALKTEWQFSLDNPDYIGGTSIIIEHNNADILKKDYCFEMAHSTGLHCRPLRFINDKNLE